MELIITKEMKSIETKLCLHEKYRVCECVDLHAEIEVYGLLFFLVHAQHVLNVYDVYLQAVSLQYLGVCPVCFMNGPVYGWPSCLTG